MAAASLTQYLLDTNILVHLIRKSPLGLWIATKYGLWDPPAIPLISVVTEGEIRSLALQFGWGPVKRVAIGEMVSYFLPVSPDYPGLCDAYARIDDFSRRNGMPMGENDVWIAATAHVMRSPLLTTDKDFAHLDPRFLTHDYIDPQSQP